MFRRRSLSALVLTGLLAAGEKDPFFWVEKRFGYAVGGKVGGTDMQALAREVYAQLAR